MRKLTREEYEFMLWYKVSRVIFFGAVIGLGIMVYGFLMHQPLTTLDQRFTAWLIGCLISLPSILFDI